MGGLTAVIIHAEPVLPCLIRPRLLEKATDPCLIGHAAFAALIRNLDPWPLWLFALNGTGTGTSRYNDRFMGVQDSGVSLTGIPSKQGESQFRYFRAEMLKISDDSVGEACIAVSKRMWAVICCQCFSAADFQASWTGLKLAQSVAAGFQSFRRGESGRVKKAVLFLLVVSETGSSLACIERYRN
ncbi:hypothetical protein GE21DRAFT_1272559 [Neurospora crassa]|nr:hypothetical protein GE21DRAFT_1272559 [Neurospora crassa]